VRFYSRSLQPEQRNYSATEKECLGLVGAVLHLRHYVEGSQFTVLSDHECLSWIYRLTTATSRLLRWRLRLAKFAFEVKYKNGANHHLPDVLSRVPTTGMDQKELDDDIPCFLLAQVARGTDANNFSAPVPPPPTTAEELLRAQGAVQLNPPYPTFTVAGRTAFSTPPVWRVVIFRFEKAHTTRVNACATA